MRIDETEVGDEFCLRDEDGNILEHGKIVIVILRKIPNIQNEFYNDFLGDPYDYGRRFG